MPQYIPGTYIGRKVRLISRYANITTNLCTVIEDDLINIWTVKEDNGIRSFRPYSPFADTPQCELVDEEILPINNTIIPLTSENVRIGLQVQFVDNPEEFISRNCANPPSEEHPDWKTKVFTIKSNTGQSIELVECRSGWIYNYNCFKLANTINNHTLLMTQQLDLLNRNPITGPKVIGKIELLNNTKSIDIPLKGYKKEILDCLLNTPHLLPVLKSQATNRKYFDKIINSLLPYKIGIEWECSGSVAESLDYQDNSMKVQTNNHIGDCVSYSDDCCSYMSTNEHRLCFNGHKQVMSVSRLCALLAKHCKLNTEAGIHYHFDMPELKDWNNSRHYWNAAKRTQFETLLRSKLNSINTILKYKGSYNRKDIGLEEKCTWVNIRYNSFKTIEIRTAGPKFDYKLIIQELILLSEIITDIRKEMKMPLYKL